MEHWIRVAHRLGLEWDYNSIITQSEVLISEIQEKFMNALTDRSRSKFRAYMYKTLEKLSLEWESSEFVGKSGEQLGAFSREIATWICNQEGPFSSEDLTEMMMSTKRPFDQNLLLKVANDVNDTVNSINEMSTFPGKFLTLRIGTRTSNLAMWQANKVQDMLNSEGLETEIIGIASQGDKSLGGDLSSSVGQFIHSVDSDLISGVSRHHGSLE